MQVEAAFVNISSQPTSVSAIRIPYTVLFHWIYLNWHWICFSVAFKICWRQNYDLAKEWWLFDKLLVKPGSHPILSE